MNEAIPLHLYLHRRVREVEGMSNIKVAQALGYDKPNVVAMMLTGSMKVPIPKVPDLARVLQLDPLALLRRAMMAYAPETWSTIEQVLNSGMPMTANEVDVIHAVREQLAGEDVALMEDATFGSEFKHLAAEALDRHVRRVLADRPGTQTSEASHRLARQNGEMAELLDQQAKERTALRKQHQRAAG